MPSHLTAERLWQIPRVGNPHVSGDTIVVPVTTFPAEPGAGTTRIWKVPGDGSPAVPVTSATSSAVKPALSPDARSIAFLRAVDGRNQVHIMPVDGGEAEVVTDLPLGVVGFCWFPDSSRLLAIGEVYADEPDLAATTVRRDATSGVTARTTESAVYRYWDRWLTDGRVPHLFVVDPGGGAPVDLTPTSRRWMRWDNTDDPTTDVAVSPDGGEVAVCFDMSEEPHTELRWSLVTIDATTGVETEITPDNPGHVTGPRYTADGAHLVYGRTEDPHFYADRVRIMRRDRTTGDTIELTQGWNRSPSAWEPDGDGLLLVAEDHGSQPLWRLALDGGAPSRLPGGGTLSGPARLTDGRVVALHHGLVSPPELVVVDRDAMHRISDFTAEAVADVEWPAVEELEIEGARGDAIQGWLVTPAGLDRAAPLVHMIHGGPHGAFGDTWHWRWNAVVFCGATRMAAMVNFHGSTGFGQEFARSIRGQWGDMPAIDVEAATDHLVASGMADPDRMAITGGSYGGYMVAWLVSQTGRYRCAVAHAAVTSLPGMYASDITSGTADAHGAEIWEDLDRVNLWSPAAHATGYATPTLVVHGERDYRVPITQGLELYGVLKAKGVDSRLVYYPDENHWILSQANSIHWYGEVIDWLERHLG